MVKICRDCANFRKSDAACLASPYVDMVTGEDKFFGASVVRQSSVKGDCGEHAIKFVARNEVPYLTHEAAHAAH